jgi:hypothetical protein
MIIQWTCRFCKRSFETETEAEVCKIFPWIKPQVCNDCDDAYVAKMGLDEKHEKACQSVAKNNRVRDILQDWEHLAARYQQYGEKREVRKLVLLAERVLAIREGRTEPDQPIRKWQR